MKIFDKVRVTAPRLNKFDLSHERKMSIDEGKLYPMLVQEVVPGDQFRVSSEVFLRMAPMLAPMMHRLDVTVHYFFVPNRLVWSEWEDFITGGRLGTSEPVAPFIMAGVGLGDGVDFPNGSLGDYLGIGGADFSQDTDQVAVSALPFRAYQLIYDEYYRDQNLQASLEVSLASGQVTGAELTKITTLRTRAWEKDYFTSALPFAQRGAEVLVPVAGDGDVSYMDVSKVYTNAGSNAADNTLLGTSNTITNGDLHVNKTTNTGAGVTGRIENIDEVTFENATATISDLRRATKLQEWLEKAARGGSRYIEQMLVFFGVKSSDARLQRPEYLGGGKTPVTISEVVSTFQETEGNPQGTMAGHGVSVGRTNQFRRRFEEHGYVIGIISVLPRTAYQQGIPRHFLRRDKFDYYWPEFAHIGEQEIKNCELYCDTGASIGTNLSTFGYTPRYAEYKYAPSTVHGEFKDTLAFWHQGRIFGSAPALNQAFVTADPSTRVFAVEDGDNNKMYCQLYNKVDALRPMPYFGTPTL